MFSLGNPVVCELMGNALLHQVYLPILIGCIVCADQKPHISINTSLFVLTQTFKQIDHSPFINALVVSLLMDRIPPVLAQRISQPLPPDVGTYRKKWMIRLPVHYSMLRFMQENFNSNCLDALIED